MLRIRQEDGSVRNLSDAEFIELLDPVSGKVVQVLHWSSRFNMLREILPDTERARNYVKLFAGNKVEFAGNEREHGG